MADIPNVVFYVSCAFLVLVGFSLSVFITICKSFTNDHFYKSNGVLIAYIILTLLILLCSFVLGVGYSILI